MELNPIRDVHELLRAATEFWGCQTKACSAPFDPAVTSFGRLKQPKRRDNGPFWDQ